MDKRGMAITAMVGGVMALGYMYLKRNPDMACKMRNMTKEMAKKTYEKLDKEM